MKIWFYILVSLPFVSGLITACSGDEPQDSRRLFLRTSARWN